MTLTRKTFLPAFLMLAASAASWGQDGKDTYLDKCSVCHGPDGAGKTARGRKMKVKDVREMVSKMNAAEMIKVVENGKGDMDAYSKELSKEKIQAVVDHYRGLAK